MKKNHGKNTEKPSKKYIQTELFNAPPKGGSVEKTPRFVRFHDSIKEFKLPFEQKLIIVQRELFEDKTEDALAELREEKKFATVHSTTIFFKNERRKRVLSSPDSASPYKRILRFWELFPFILPSKTRREAFEPAYNDLLADYLRALRIKTKWAKRWLLFSFTLRTAFMVVNCFWVMAGSKVRTLFLHSIWEGFRRLSGN